MKTVVFKKVHQLLRVAFLIAIVAFGSLLLYRQQSRTRSNLSQRVHSQVNENQGARGVHTVSQTGDFSDAKLSRAKSLLPWRSERELKDLIDQGVNVENIEPGQPRVSVDLSLLRVAISQYQKVIGEPINGSSAEVARAVLGNNSKNIAFIEWPPKRIGRSGELLDPWGTPYQMTNIADRGIEIRSAGQDLTFWTADDQVSSP